MKLAKGPRPWPIRLFVVFSLAVGVLSFPAELAQFDSRQFIFGFALDPDTDRDLMIVIQSAKLTIVAIPLALIWFLASNFARWLVSIMTLLTSSGPLVLALSAWRDGVIGPEFLILPVLIFAAPALLFTRPAHPWFAKDKIDAQNRV